ncbi:hypothetical protein F5Y14DRAFT_413571 [Nemania sp. NC0429]|nr:hypothetical protein F5Y14DRAFT_413571 [Nemania sp. NC0429]
MKGWEEPDACKMTIAKTNPLKRKSSSWQMVQHPSQEEYDLDAENRQGRYSLLLFLRDLEAGDGKLSEFVEGLRSAPGVLDENSTMAAVLEAALNIGSLDRDDINSVPAPHAKKRRLGNGDAAALVAEHDELVTLARTVWTDPDDLRDVVGDLYRLNMRGSEEGKGSSLDYDIFDWSRSWSEVRFRLLYQALRDDPALWLQYNDGPTTARGNHLANKLVHDSHVLLDAQMVDFKSVLQLGSDDADLKLFSELYMITPEEGRQLCEYVSPPTGLRAGLPAVFEYCVQFIDSFVGWRIRALESARREILAAGTPQKNAARRSKASQGTAAARLRSIDDLYIDGFIGPLRDLLQQAATQNAFEKATYDELEHAARRLVGMVRSSAAALISSANSDLLLLHHDPGFRKITAAFPGPKNLIRPTGTSLKRSPRRALRARASW